MGFSNSTPNLHLPQWVANDKPDWLIDMNNAFSTIDGAVTSSQTDITGVTSRLAAAETNIASNVEAIHQNATGLVAANNAIAKNSEVLGNRYSVTTRIEIASMTLSSSVTATGYISQLNSAFGHVLIPHITFTTTADIPIVSGVEPLVTFKLPFYPNIGECYITVIDTAYQSVMFSLSDEHIILIRTTHENNTIPAGVTFAAHYAFPIANYELKS